MYGIEMFVKVFVVIALALLLSAPTITAFKEAEFKVLLLLKQFIAICLSEFGMPSRE